MEPQFNIDFSVQNNNYHSLPINDIITLSNNNDPEALFELGIRLLHNMLNEQDINGKIKIADYPYTASEGYDLIHRSTLLGHSAAIAFCLIDDIETFLWIRDMVTSMAVEIYKHPLNSTYPPAIFGLGLCYEYGIGVKPDMDHALKLYRKAISYNYHLAISKMADILFTIDLTMSFIYRYSIRHIDSRAMSIFQSKCLLNRRLYILFQFLGPSVTTESIIQLFGGIAIFDMYIENKPSAIDWFINQHDDDRNFILKQQKTHALIIEAIGMLPFPIAEEIIPHIIAYDNDIIKNNG